MNLHFVALVHHGGRLWELDGRKPFPIDHGPTSEASLLKVRGLQAPTVLMHMCGCGALILSSACRMRPRWCSASS